MTSSLTRIRWTCIGLVLSTLLAVNAVSADELILRDGSRMLGTVIKKDSAVL